MDGLHLRVGLNSAASIFMTLGTQMLVGSGATGPGSIRTTVA